MDTNLTTITSPPAARSLHDICEAARRGSCGPFCGALPGADTGAVVNTHSSPGSAPQNGPQLPRRAASQMAWSERAAGGLVIVERLVSTWVPQLR